jgi:hypothetical protein
MVGGLSIGGLWYGGLEWGLVDEEVVASETRIPLAALRIEDPERGAPTLRTVAIAGDERLGPLPDDVATQADPRPSNELEANAGRLGDRGRETAGQARRLEHEQHDLGPAGERGQSMEAVGDLGRSIDGRQPTAGQVEDEQVDRAAGEQAPGDRQALVERGRRDDDQPFEPNTAGDGLDRVEAAREIQPGHDRALRLGFRGDPEGERRPAARAVTADRDAGRPGQAAGPQDRVERRETGPDDALVGAGRHLRNVVGLGRDRQRADDSRSCRSPASPQARDGGVHIGARGRHRTSRLEHLF